MAVRLIQLLTLLGGGVFAVEGVLLLLVWADVLTLDWSDLATRIVNERDLVFLAVLGSLFFGLGQMALVAGWVLPSRRSWGRPLTLVLALLAIAFGLYFYTVISHTPDRNTAADFALAAAPVVYGTLTSAVLSWNAAEPVGLYVFRLLNILVGLPLALGLGFVLPEFVEGFFPREGTSRGDLGSRCLALAAVGGFVASVLIAATGVNLLVPHRRRFRTSIFLQIVAGVAALAMAAFCLWGGLFGHSKGGLTEASLIVLGLPCALGLFLLTAIEIWYLRRPATRGV